ncbi:MAG: hypothetical protein PHW13_01030 [Methylococcales bacterium]|nr:hypothetical protein [Methylococcales bacterium]
MKTKTTQTPLDLQPLATVENFDELAYLRANPDVKAAIESGQVNSGREHFIYHGKNEGRHLLFTPPLRKRSKVKKGFKTVLINTH